MLQIWLLLGIGYLLPVVLNLIGWIWIPKDKQSWLCTLVPVINWISLMTLACVLFNYYYNLQAMKALLHKTLE